MNKKFIAIPAIALAAGLGLAACGSQSASHAAAPAVTHSAAAAPTTAAPKPAPKPTVNYGQQYVTDVAAANTAIKAVNVDPTVPFTSAVYVTAGNDMVAVSQTLLGQTWPANAQADIHTLATDGMKVQVDIHTGDVAAFNADEETFGSQAQVVRADLGLPANGN